MFLRQSEGTKNSAKDDKKSVTKAGNIFFMIFLNIIILNVVFLSNNICVLAKKFSLQIFYQQLFPNL